MNLADSSCFAAPPGSAGELRKILGSARRRGLPHEEGQGNARQGNGTFDASHWWSGHFLESNGFTVTATPADLPRWEKLISDFDQQRQLMPAGFPGSASILLARVRDSTPKETRRRDASAPGFAR